MADGTLKQNTGEGKENDTVPPGVKTFHIPVSHAVFPSSANHAGTDEARSDALSSVKEGADKMLHYCEVFTAFKELFLPDCCPGNSLSSEAREGLAYMFKLLADDAINMHMPLFGAWEELTRGEGHA